MQLGDDAVISRLLAEFADIFVGPDGELGATAEAEHTIDTGDHVPVKQRPYIPHELRGTSNCGARV